MNATKTETEWTDEALRIAIAEVCGTLRPGKPIHEHRYGPGPMKVIARGKPISPNYPSDLNACHEMEKVLTAEHIFPYEIHLCQIIHQDGPVAPGPLGFEWHASARQRCLAFVKTLGLSPDGTNASGISVLNQGDWNTRSLGGVRGLTASPATAEQGRDCKPSSAPFQNSFLIPGFHYPNALP